MASEESVGIIAYTTPGNGFRAITKQRFSDFIVREVNMDGSVLKLKALPEMPPEAPEADDVPETAEAQLATLIGEASASAVLELQRKAAAAVAARGGGKRGHASSSTVDEVLVLPRDDDKEHRTQVHRLVKQLLPSIITDTVDTEGGKGVRLQAKAGASKRGADNRGKGGGGGKRQRVDQRSEWPEEAGASKYLAFTLYKENRDTTEALSRIARGCGVGHSVFSQARTAPPPPARPEAPHTRPRLVVEAETAPR
jgi:tRNA pseudouridine13 synthase